MQDTKIHTLGTMNVCRKFQGNPTTFSVYQSSRSTRPLTCHLLSQAASMANLKKKRESRLLWSKLRNRKPPLWKHMAPITSELPLTFTWSLVCMQESNDLLLMPSSFQRVPWLVHRSASVTSKKTWRGWALRGLDLSAPALPRSVSIEGHKTNA